MVGSKHGAEHWSGSQRPIVHNAGTNAIVSRLGSNTSFDVSGFGKCRLVKL